MEKYNIPWICLFGITLAISSCKSVNHIEHSQTYNYPWINPLTELLGETILPDTTFSFPGGKTLPFKPIELDLPDSLGGQEINGSARIFAILEANGEVESIKIHSYQFTRKRKMVHDYHAAVDLQESDIFFLKFKAFLEREIPQLPIEKNIDSLDEGKEYPTFCYLRF